MSTSSARIVQYGRRAKHRPASDDDDVQPALKRQKTGGGAVVNDANDTLVAATNGVHPSLPAVPLVSTRPNTPEPESSSTPRSAPMTRTPSAKPKDLSSLFVPLTVSPARSPGKSIAKRMLVRARTEPDLSSPASPKPSVAVAASLPIVSSSPQHDSQRSPPPSPSPAPRPTFRTYSQSRSFLVSLPASTAPDTHADTDEVVRESYTDLRTRWGVDNSEDDPYHVPGITNELMSMTELRSKGESRRFLDEVGYLFEGLEQPGMSISVKRSSAVEIALKMCDAEFVRKAKAADFIGRAWDAMRLAGAGDGDKVLDPCLAFFVALVSRNKRDADNLARRGGFFDAMMRLLGTSRDTDGLALDSATVRKTKAEKATLTNLRNIITNSTLVAPPTLPSTRALSSLALSALSPRTLTSSLLRPLLSSLLAELALVDTPDSAAVPYLAHAEQCLRILDAFLLTTPDVTIDEEEGDTLCKGLVALCTSASVLESAGEHTHLARQCIESTFRVLINLSHRSPTWCARLLRTPAALLAIVPHIFPPPVRVKQEHEDDDGDVEGDGALDRQCIALGVLTNVALARGETGERIREMQLDPTCPRGRRCARACHCAERTTALESLVRLFLTTDIKRESNTAAADLSFFRCHLAALLVLLNPPNVPGLAASVRQFLEFYASLPGEGDGGGDGDIVKRVGRALEVIEG